MKVGLVVNPFAGLGGPAGLKGSDGIDTVKLARQRGVTSRIAERIEPVLALLGACDLVTAPGDLGQKWCEIAHLNPAVVPVSMPDGNEMTTAEHTQQAVKLIQDQDPDLILFVGGDGTARDVMDVIDSEQVALGIPCGVKMHSAVFANNPMAAREIVDQMIRRELLTITRAEVRDIDEVAFRRDTVRSKFYGEMWVPESLRYMQQVKSGGKEDEAIVVEEIAADFIDNMSVDTTYLMGSGSTVAAVMRKLDLSNTLLGVDVVQDGRVIASDVFESQLFEIVKSQPCKIAITVIGGQGHLLGRGNQQFSPRIIEAVGLENVIVLATKTKLESLPNGILVDTGSRELDQKIQGFIRVTTGYDDAVLCPVTA